MFKKKNKIEVVPESEYTDYSHRFEEEPDRSEYATKETYMVAALIPTTAALGLMVLTKPTPIAEQTSQMIPASTTPIIEPVTTPISSTLPVNITSTPDMIPVGYISDKSLDMLANVLDPIIDLLIAISFPIASVMVIGALFFLMFGNSERAMSSLMKTCVGYCLIQLSPLLLGILRTLGKSVAQQ